MTKQWQPLTDYQWAAISPFFDLQRKRKHELRTIMDAIFWLLRTGCQWRNLPPNFPHWQAVYYYFDRWKKAGHFEHINAALNQLDRQQADREPLPSATSIDTQSVKLAPMIGELRGLDANKKINGRKRTFVVDTQGRLWVAHVDAANRADGSLGEALVIAILWRVGERLEKVFGDQAYNGVFAKELARWSIDFEKASRPESAQGFVPLANRWVVEPVRRRGSIAWPNYFRRIVKDYEHTVTSSASWLYLANSQIMLQRIETYYQM
jgi:transposase